MVADRVGVLNGGRLEQLSCPEEIYHRPRRQPCSFRRPSELPARPGGESEAPTLVPFPSPSVSQKGSTVEVMIRPHHRKCDLTRQARAW